MPKPPPREVLERRIGEVVKARYRLTGLVGVGGQGAVYRATDQRDGDEVAIKVLHEQVDRNPKSRERLVREAQALMALSGTSVVQVLDQGFTQDGRLSLVTELLVGEDFEELLLRMEANGYVFPASDLPFVFEPIIATLEKAHALHIVHRDLKPENVFLEKAGEGMRVRLMDFGFARFQHMTRLTMDGFIAGSPSYIAPETWLEKPAETSVDVYALSAMIFRALAGRPPFTTKSVTEMYRLATTARRPSLHAMRLDLPAGIDAWVEQALAIDPRARFLTPRAAYRALASIVGLNV